ncbi:MAG: toxin-antitoxin system YwqK family antitoxin [Saprospiraceae bacterium]|nr:toxin-antitoxin system YwqK family antitoxin [Saprospiraceae bacterium]
MLSVQKWQYFAFLCACWLFAACQSNIETVENRDAFNRLERFERRKKDFAREGLYQRFHEKGYLLEEAHYLNDSLEGERKYFYPNGKTERVEHYARGIIHGPFLQYYDDGQLQLQQTFANGVLQGLSTSWYPNGAIKEKVTLADNEENGPFTEWYENGKIKAEGNYLDGDNEDGELKLYDTLGQLERVLKCQRGACQTQWTRTASDQDN